MTRLNHWLFGSVLTMAILVLQGWLDERDHNVVDEVDCSTPLKAGESRVHTVVVDHRTMVRCKA